MLQAEENEDDDLLVDHAREEEVPEEHDVRVERCLELRAVAVDLLRRQRVGPVGVLELVVGGEAGRLLEVLLALVDDGLADRLAVVLHAGVLHEVGDDGGVELDGQLVFGVDGLGVQQVCDVGDFLVGGLPDRHVEELLLHRVVVLRRDAAEDAAHHIRQLAVDNFAFPFGAGAPTPRRTGVANTVVPWDNDSVEPRWLQPIQRHHAQTRARCAEARQHRFVVARWCRHLEHFQRREFAGLSNDRVHVAAIEPTDTQLFECRLSRRWQLREPAVCSFTMKRGQRQLANSSEVLHDTLHVIGRRRRCRRRVVPVR
mmetsp:Transcript_26943/g.83391  ORF Transcript_26943/g.83391 Transcript_26943/m.83391 type:complete len:314 (+) Transcript_26943:590-1531(+)